MLFNLTKVSYVLLIFVLIKPFTCARILAVFPTPFRTHHVVFQSLCYQLAVNGHNVTTITTEPIKNYTFPNLTQIDISFTYNFYYDQSRMQQSFNTKMHSFIWTLSMANATNNLTRTQMQHPAVQYLINTDNAYDLMLVEIHDPAWFGLAKKYNCPVIGVTSTLGGATNHFKRLLGNFLNPVLTPNADHRFGNSLSYMQRVFSVCVEFFDELWRSLVSYPTQQTIAAEALDDPTINLLEILRNNLSLLFVTTIPGFHQTMINLPVVVPLHGLQIKPPGALPADLQLFMDEASEGVIYLSLGSVVKSSFLPPKKRSMFLKVFAAMPYKVVWKFEEQIANLPKNVKMISWAPQQDILRHKNTKLFISHGSHQSVEESILFKVPILAFPFFGDQFHNAITVAQNQIGTWLQFETLTNETLKTTILESIDNYNYLKNLDKLSDLQKQFPPSLDKAIWWVEYVLKYKGARHLRSPLLDVPFYQQYLYDVVMSLIACFAITALILTKCFL